MAMDVYSPCPGGTGKKIKFCCTDLVGELEKIDRMIEGDQHQAGLSYVQSLLAKRPDRACLLAARSLLLDLTQQWEAAEAAAEEFSQAHAGNPLPWAEKAMLSARRGESQAAVPFLQRALNATGAQMLPRVYEAIAVVAEALANDGQSVAAIPLLMLQTLLAPDDQAPLRLMAELTASPDVPLLAKSERRLPAAPADAPWKSRYEDALKSVGTGCWSVAAERMGKLLEEFGDQPVLWRALATLRAWLTQTDSAVEALRKYCSLHVPLEDAVEAQTLALLFAEDSLGDALDILYVTFTVTDVEQLLAAMTISRQIAPAKVDPMSLVEEDEPPPKAVYYLLDRAKPEPDAELTLENTPRVYGQALLFGRQTDREARLEIATVRADQLAEVEELLRRVSGELIQGPVEREAVDKISKTQDSLLPNLWFPEGASLEQIRRVSEAKQHHAIYDGWIELPLGSLDGKTPREAAGLEEYRVRVLGAILLMETWFESRPDGFDLNPLREKLGLPTLGSIDPRAVDFKSLPLIRLARIETDKLSEEQLVDALRMAASFLARPAAKRFSLAILERPGLAGREAQLDACAMLARLEGPTDRAFEYIEQGRNTAQSLNQSCGMWDLLEITHRFARREVEDFARLLNHIQSRHLNEPGVAQALARFLVQTGMVRPDGSLAVPRGAEGPQEAGVMPQAAAAEPGKLWTPESQRPAEERKIWMPGMD